MAQTQAGVETPWDARKTLANVINSEEQLKPILAGLNPQQWYDQKGASSTYILQWQSAQQQLRDVDSAAKMLSQHIESLSQNLDLYYRLEALETTVRSVNEGAQRYASPAEGGKLAQWVAHAFDTRQRLREYIRDLAGSLEQNFKIADEEAQRCRGLITTAPASPARRSTKH